MKPLYSAKGFTLIELMVTVALIAVMAAIALPNMSAFLSSQRLGNRVEQISTLFRFSRAEAVRLNRPVVICGGITLKTDGKPNNGCDKGGQTLLAFSENGSPDFNYQTTDTDLRSVLITNNGNSNITLDVLNVDLTKSSSSSNPRYFMYTADGRFSVKTQTASSTATGFISGQHYLRLSATDGKRVRMALLDPGGRIISCGATMPKSVFDALSPSDYKNYCTFDRN